MTDNDRLATLTANYLKIADAAAWFRVRLLKGLAGTAMWGDALLHDLRRELDPAHFNQLEKSIATWHTKATVSPMSTATDPSLAEPVAWPNAFRGLADGVTAVFQLGATVIPLNSPVPSINSEASPADFVGEGLPVPVSAQVTLNQNMSPFKVGVANVWTRELGANSNPRIQAVVETKLRHDLGVGIDRRLFDPDFAGSAGVSPAAICHGKTEIMASGTDYETAMRDALMAVSSGNPERPVAAMNRRNAIYFSALRNSSGARMFPDMSITGGQIFGCPVVVGSGIPDVVTVLDASALVIGDGGLDLAVSRQASVQMSDAPTNPAQQTSLFQSGLIALQLTRELNYTLGRSEACCFFRVALGGSPF